MDHPTLFRVGFCADCGLGFPAGRAGAIASRCAQCRETVRRKAMYELGRQKSAQHIAERRKRPCSDCGKPWDRPAKDTNGLRCPPCRARHKREWQKVYDQENADRLREAARRLRRADPERFAAYKAKRRAAVAASSEFIRPSEIFERDGWTCQLCGKHLDPEVKYPSNDSPSLDHIIPIALGGPHSRANVQAACMGCNRSKGARYVG